VVKPLLLGALVLLCDRTPPRPEAGRAAPPRALPTLAPSCTGPGRAAWLDVLEHYSAYARDPGRVHLAAVHLLDCEIEGAIRQVRLAEPPLLRLGLPDRLVDAPRSVQHAWRRYASALEVLQLEAPRDVTEDGPDFESEPGAMFGHVARQLRNPQDSRASREVHRFRYRGWCGNGGRGLDELRLRSRVLDGLHRGETVAVAARALVSSRGQPVPWLEALVKRAGWDLDDLLAGGSAGGAEGYANALCTRGSARARGLVIELEGLGWNRRDSARWSCLKDYQPPPRAKRH
jgi:hypothetical protein